MVLNEIIIASASLIAGIIIGAIIMYAARKRSIDPSGLRDIFKSVSHDIAREQSASFKTEATEPMLKAVEDLRNRIETMERSNVSNRSLYEELAKQTGRISNILSSSQKRGSFAEMRIEQILQTAGFEKGIHYDVQVVADTGRPDFVVHLSDQRNIVIDSKSPQDALESAFDADGEAERVKALDEHVKAVKSHINNLSKKEYYRDFHQSLDYTVMVMPEHVFLPAVERDSKLSEYALEKRVVLVTPAILILLLNAIDLMWKQKKMTDSVKEISDVASTLHERLNTFARHYDKTGKELIGVIKKYNDSVASWDSRVMPSAEKLAEVSAVQGEIPVPNRIEESPRLMTTNESEES